MNEALRHIPAECLAFKSRMASRAVTRAYDEALRPIDLRITQFTILVAVALGEPESISAFADMLGMDRTTLIRNLDVMERSGLIERTGEGYRRQRGVRLTKAGKAKLEEALPLWEEVQKEARRLLEADAAQWEDVGQVLQKIRKVG